MKKSKMMISEGFTRRDALKLYGVGLGVLAMGNPTSAFGANKEFKMIFPYEKELR